MPTPRRRDQAAYSLPLQAAYQDGYHLVRRASVLETACPAYGEGKVFLSEYDVCRRLCPRRARLVGREWSTPLKFFPDANQYGRWDLKLNLVDKRGKTVRCAYSRLVALSLLKTVNDTAARKCGAHYVHPEDYHLYEVDHWPIPDQCDCRLANKIDKVIASE